MFVLYQVENGNKQQQLKNGGYYFVRLVQDLLYFTKLHFTHKYVVFVDEDLSSGENSSSKSVIDEVLTTTAIETLRKLKSHNCCWSVIDESKEIFHFVYEILTNEKLDIHEFPNLYDFVLYKVAKPSYYYGSSITKYQEWNTNTLQVNHTQ